MDATQKLQVIAQPDLGRVPTVAVVIIARNARRTIGDALTSLALQTSKADQVVVVDNESTDDTWSFAGAMADELDQPLTLLSGKGNNLSALRNLGNRDVRTDYIAVLDADDLYAPDALASFRAAIVQRGWPDVIYGDCEYFGDAFASVKRYPRYDSARALMRAVLARPAVPFKHSSMIYSREAWERIGGYDESFPRQIDIALMCGFLAAGLRVEKLDQVIARHRRHEGQSTKARLSSLHRWGRLIDRFEPSRWRRPFLKIARYGAEILKRLLQG